MQPLSEIPKIQRFQAFLVAIFTGSKAYSIQNPDYKYPTRIPFTIHAIHSSNEFSDEMSLSNENSKDEYETVFYRERIRGTFG